MKLAFVVFRFFPFGGMQRNMLAIADACAAAQHCVTVLCGEWQGEVPEGLTVQRLPFIGWGNGAQMKSFYDEVANYLDYNSVDLVVGFNKFPGLDAYYAADSCFATKAFEQRGWLYRQTPRSKVYLAFERAVFATISHTQILEVSPVERSAFQTYYQTPDARFHTLHPGIARNRRVDNVDKLAIANKRAELGIAESTQVFLAIGSGFKTKGLERSIHLLAAWQKQQKEPALLLVAGQDKSASFMRLAKRLGVAENIRFLGGRDDIPDLLQIAQVVLHPAHRENTGNVILEAMIAGRPVIATEVCGYAHYIDSAQMGVILPAQFTTEDYVAAVTQVLAESDDTWRERGRKFAQQETIYSRPQQVVQLLEQFLTEKRVAE